MPRYPRRLQMTVIERSAALVLGTLIGLFVLGICLLVKNALASTVIAVHANDNLQAKLDSAQPGDTLLLDAGAVFSSVTINKSNLTITTTGATARIETPGPDPAVIVNGSGNKLIGLEITTKQNPQYTGILVQINGADNTIEQSYIHSLEDGTDSLFASVKIGVFVNGPRTRLIGNRIANPGALIMGSTTFDNTAAVMDITEPGLELSKNFLSAHFTPIFIGGGDLKGYQTATITNPSMTVATFSNVSSLTVGTLVALADGPALPPYTGLYFEVAKVTAINGNQVSYTPWAGSIGSKPDCAGDCGTPLKRVPLIPGEARWNGQNPSARITQNTVWINPVVAQKIQTDFGRNPKGFIEAKAGDLYIEGNDFTGFPATMTFTQHNQTGPHGGPSPWSKLSINFRNNRVADISRSFGSQVFSVLGEDNVGTSVIGGPFVIENNLLAYGGWIGDFIGGTDVTIRHNTILNNAGWPNGRLLNALYVPIPNYKLLDNIAYNNEYGVSYQAGGSLPGLQMAGNVLVTETIDPNRPNCANVYPAGNSCPQSLTLVNYQLPVGSPYKGKATDGKDPGVDYQALLAAIGGTPSPSPTPIPSPSVAPSPSPVPTPSPSPQPSPSLVPNTDGGRETMTVDWPSGKNERTMLFDQLSKAGWTCLLDDKVLYCKRP